MIDELTAYHAVTLLACGVLALSLVLLARAPDPDPDADPPVGVIPGRDYDAHGWLAERIVLVPSPMAAWVWEVPADGVVDEVDACEGRPVRV